MKRLSRRTVLRGVVAGTAVGLGLPLLDAMLPSRSKAADDALPIFGLLFWSNGLPWHAKHGSAQAGTGHPDLWTPATTGPGYAPTPLITPLARHEPTVLTGLTPKTEVPSTPGGQSDGHMRGFMVAMTGDRPRPEGFHHPSHTLTALRPSLDQHVARHTTFYDGDSPRYRSLHVGVSRARFHDYGHWNAISYNGPDSLNPPILDAGVLYDQLFGLPTGDPDLVRRAALLDAVLEDANDLRADLGTADQARLDEHLEHLYEVQRRLDTSGAVCEIPPRPGDSGDFLTQTGRLADLLAIGLSCGMTRVFTFMLTSPASTHIFSDVGVREGHHKNCHDGKWEDVRKVTLRQMQAFALVLDALAERTDAAGHTLLDRALVYGTSEYGEGWKHGVAELPVVMAGGAAGRLQRGVHVRDPDGNLATAQLTALRALGIETDSFGFNGAETTASYDELLR